MQGATINKNPIGLPVGVVRKALWESFPADNKPEWLPYGQILAYEGKMCGVEVFFTFGSWEKYPYNMGYVSVVAPSVKEAIAAFRSNYPDVNEGLLNCADYYCREDDKARIRETGNGSKCHRRIDVFHGDKQVDAVISAAADRCQSNVCDSPMAQNTDKEFC